MYLRVYLRGVPWEVYPGVYIGGVYPGVYIGGYTQGVYKGGVPRVCIREVYPGCERGTTRRGRAPESPPIPVSLLASSPASLLYSRFTVGQKSILWEK